MKSHNDCVCRVKMTEQATSWKTFQKNHHLQKQDMERRLVLWHISNMKKKMGWVWICQIRINKELKLLFFFNCLSIMCVLIGKILDFWVSDFSVKRKIIWSVSWTASKICILLIKSWWSISALSMWRFTRENSSKRISTQNGRTKTLGERKCCQLNSLTHLYENH